MMLYLITLTIVSFLFSNSNESCVLNQSEFQFRTVYNIGDTLSIEDQNQLYPVCNGSDGYETGDSFRFADLNGDLNGGDYKFTIISMNATW